MSALKVEASEGLLSGSVLAGGGAGWGVRDDGLVWCTQCMFDICVFVFLNAIFGSVLKMSAVK